MIPLTYCVCSFFFLITIYIKNIKQKKQAYQPLLNDQQQNSSYGYFQGQFDDNSDDQKDDDDYAVDGDSDTTPVSSDDPAKRTTRNFDIIRLFFSSVMLIIFCLMVFSGWLNYKQDGIYPVVAPLIEMLIWVITNQSIEISMFL